MNSGYLVLHKRDYEGEKRKENNKKRGLYGARKGFSDYENAIRFALDHLDEDPIVMFANYLLSGEMLRSKNYVIAAYFRYKYGGSSYENDSSIPTYEIIRCSQSKLEEKLRSIAKERPDKIYWGLETKLMQTRFTGA